MRYFMVVIRGVFLEGTPFVMLTSQFWPMAAIGLFSLVLAGWMFRRRLY
jgi:ABC-2 type transport system permease protein